MSEERQSPDGMEDVSLDALSQSFARLFGGEIPEQPGESEDEPDEERGQDHDRSLGHGARSYQRVPGIQTARSSDPKKVDAGPLTPSMCVFRIQFITGLHTMTSGEVRHGR